MQSFTPEDLVQYMYNETSPQKTAAIQEALQIDWDLREKYEVISSSKRRLEVLELFAPRKKAVDNIVSYGNKARKQFITEV